MARDGPGWPGMARDGPGWPWMARDGAGRPGIGARAPGIGVRAPPKPNSQAAGTLVHAKRTRRHRHPVRVRAAVKLEQAAGASPSSRPSARRRSSGCGCRGWACRPRRWRAMRAAAAAGSLSATCARRRGCAASLTQPVASRPATSLSRAWRPSAYHWWAVSGASLSHAALACCPSTAGVPLSVPAAVAATAYVIHSEHHPPRPEYIADGDADGDLYYVCWDAELVALLEARCTPCSLRHWTYL